MSKAQEVWRERGIYNSHNLAKQYAEQTGKPGVYLGWSPDGVGRIGMGQHAGYWVIRPGYNTNPQAVSFRDKNKFFMKFSDREGFENAAKHWATDRYDLSGEWAKIPGFPRDWFPAEMAEWAKGWIK